MGVSSPVLFDPAELAQRFAAPDEDESIARCELVADILTPLLERIPKTEREIVYLYYTKGKRQREIARVYGVTQAAISYRLHRAVARMRFIASLPRVTEEGMRDVLAELFVERDVNILVAIWRSSGQTEVAARLGLAQTTVRDCFFRCVRGLEVAMADDERYEPYHRLFTSIVKAGWNILREVKAPSGTHRRR